MGYCCQGSEDYVTWNELKKKCAEMSKLIDQKFKDLDDGEILELLVDEVQGFGRRRN